MAVHVTLITVLVASALLEVLLYVTYVSRSSDGYKIYPLRGKDLRRIARVMLPNSLLSGALIVGLTYGGQGWLLHTGETSALGVVADVVATLVLYDLIYYCMHRYLFHGRLQWVHVLHHTVKYPTAIESLYVHPIENAMGVLLFIACIWIVGPISLWGFAVALAIYSWLNIVIHSGLDFRHAWLRPVAYMVRKHARHHSSMRAGNYASITPIPDLVFGTAE
ncbi:sterol desaturase family protein [Enhygromyxa salina]|uniref:Fatty acid hydroxylase superfamily protein n=1 Tax=Enhygromyxa salina TaxID=215803 RepID=A0A2S9Y7N0_9BACT|nr:sterol desaturase family protein [Enhygromyxa salina]PRQ01118.1 Fatty acid hydroxylase superfamily protein [Enhygromyxa salina]